MSSARELESRIKSVKNTRQITKAMELVSATKMRKSQEVALVSRPYAIQALKLLSELEKRTEYVSAIMQKREIKRTLIVLIAGDRGLAGSLNANVFRTLEREIPESLSDPDRYVFLTVGKKCEEYLTRKNIKPYVALKNYGDYAHTEEVKPFCNTVITGFLKGEWDKVLTVSTHFKSTLRQEVLVREILPVTHKQLEETIKEITPETGRFSKSHQGEETEFMKNFDYLIEPDPESVLDYLAPRLIEIELYHLMLEANASEHSARMVAMKNASENAEELKDELTLIFNKSRQAAITNEISEITAGVEALRK
ncbi:MAG: ATP synthase F1 subunit gamma [Candidatus Harrisonbacteria bacterium CG10_big_fil_rev_8_21_14_0_10_42_17]|uniref:ATP synthase gamma chain n=1 Tax=Candidatus Harrisonbacteria bacterium CG10_big_fil_rev_8_21_14_0_10_42_17 TaxID=1974584 RepID=A0A2M6WGT9_9BACT|nr:MAG: ATP synthase F1 subunit gamma [Candidatus Harrisonbacteria bacterium CG10_big_fil_rev_8_21_14_0_10_42_17]